MPLMNELHSILYGKKTNWATRIINCAYFMVVFVIKKVFRYLHLCFRPQIRS